MAGLYQKYGSTLDGDGMGKSLAIGQQAVNSSFKEALTGIGDLLKTVEQGYVDDNTTKVQDYLKNNIRTAGIGADAPTTEDIKSQFGKLINPEAIDKVVTSTRDKMLGEARDEASIEAGKAFGETEDIAKAGEAFKQKFLALGGRESQAADEMGKWRLDNAYRTEDVKLRDAELISKFKAGVAADIISNKQTNPDEVLNFSLDMLPEKLRTQAKLETIKETEALSALRGDQPDARAYIGTLYDSQIQSLEAEINQTLDLAKEELAKTSGIPQSARDAVTKLNSTLGGMGEAVRQDATGKWFASSLFNKNNKEEEGASRALQENIDSLMAYGDISAEDAQAIGFLAYQDARAESGVGIGGGVSIQADVLQRHFNKYAQQYPEAKKAEDNYKAIQAAAIKKRTALLAEKEKALYDFTREAKHANISGSHFDSQEYISRFSDGGSGPTSTAPTTQTNTSTGSSNSSGPTGLEPTEAELEERRLRNTAGLLQSTHATENKTVAIPNPIKAAEQKLKNDLLNPTIGLPTTIRSDGSRLTTQEQIAANKEAGDLIINTATDVISTPFKKVGEFGSSIRSWMKKGGLNDYGNLNSSELSKSSPEAAQELKEIEQVRAGAGIKNNELNNAIVEATIKSGLPADTLFTFALFESNGGRNLTSPSGTMKGPFQWSPESAEQYGIKGKEYGNKESAMATARMIKDNAKELSSAGIETNTLNLYLAHQQGAVGIKEIIDSAQTGKPLSRVRIAKIKANLPKSLQHLASNPQVFLEHWESKYAQLQQKMGNVA